MLTLNEEETVEAQRPAGIVCRVSLGQVEDAVSLQRSKLMAEKPDESEKDAEEQQKRTGTPTDQLMTEKT